MNEPDARTYLEQLRTELTARAWRARLDQRGGVIALKVCNPEVADLAEVVTCRRQPDGWVFCWPGGQLISSTENIRTAADRIQHVLRAVEA
jgi:hypothetical protein